MIDLEKENMSFQLPQEAAMPCPLQHTAVSSSQGLTAIRLSEILALHKVCHHYQLSSSWSRASRLVTSGRAPTV